MSPMLEGYSEVPEGFACDRCGFVAASKLAMSSHLKRKDHRPDYVAPDAGQESGAERFANTDQDEETPPTPAEDLGEVAPRKPRLFERIRNRRGRGSGGGHHAPPAPGERAPRQRKRVGRRVALDMDISDIWAFGGRRLEATPHYATGRMLQYQAPAAGVIIDRAIAGTLPDRVLLQPIARNRSKYEDVGFLLAGPVLTFAITQTGMQLQAAIQSGDGEAAAQLAAKLEVQKEGFRWLVSMMLPRLAAGAKLAREKQAKRDADIADAFPELAMGEDPVEVFANMMFTPPTFQEAQTNGKTGSTPSYADPEGAVQ